MFPSAKRRIFVVERDIHMMDGIKDILELENYLVLATTDVHAARLVIDDFYPDIALISISNALAPREFLLMHPCRYRYPVICLNYFNYMKKTSNFQWIGEEGEFLSRPFDPEDLVNAVARILARRYT